MRPVEIVDYDPSWPAQFAAERGVVLGLLGDRVDGIHHIGSTAVPGLAAKPKIDMDAVLRADSFVAEAIERLRETGNYDYHGDPYGDRRWTFTRGRSRGIRLYLCGPGNIAHQERILFRDWLRSHPDDAEAYAALKRGLAAKARGDFQYYTDGKSAFVAGIVGRARAEMQPAPGSQRLIMAPGGNWKGAAAYSDPSSHWRCLAPYRGAEDYSSSSVLPLSAVSLANTALASSSASSSFSFGASAAAVR